MTTTTSVNIDGFEVFPESVRTSPGIVLLYAPNYEQFSPAYVMDGRDLIFGRDARCNISIPDSSVSRQHAKIQLRHGQWILTDLGARNGTLVNGKVVAQVQLKHLDQIRIGNAIFKFVESEAQQYARYRIDGTIVGEVPASYAERMKRRSELVGGYQLDKVATVIEKVAPTDVSIVIYGESGSGKENIARHAHNQSNRRGLFQAINCAAIPANLLESELFGYKRGAFSGANKDQQGLVRAADGGTLFLDEIGDMPLEAQAKLLRVIQQREVMPLGASVAEKVDVRIVCATHRDLHQYVKEGKFRGDLYSRLNEMRVVLPPLRERKEDIFMLCSTMLSHSTLPSLRVSLIFMAGLLHYDFPFNVRELQAFIKRAVALSSDKDKLLELRHLPDEVVQAMSGYGKPASVVNVSIRTEEDEMDDDPGGRRNTPTKIELCESIVRHDGNISAVSREYGRTRMQIHRWIEKYQIDLDNLRNELGK